MRQFMKFLRNLETEDKICGVGKRKSMLKNERKFLEWFWLILFWILKFYLENYTKQGALKVFMSIKTEHRVLKDESTAFF